ncbi:MAG: GntR family transcriptional regulator [Erysipelotrichia bacterium]|nr:GntR family transcriptional regulator [Erysipelotrichia bacterium]
MKKEHFLYEEIKQNIIDNIKKGIYPIGKKLPAEEELIEKFSASHMTVNKALVSLADSGYIKRIKKKGSYVLCKDVERNMNEMMSFTEQYKRGGVHISSILLDYRLIKVRDCLDEYLTDLFDVKESDNIHYFSRIRLIDDKPIQVQKDLVSAKIVPYIDTRYLTQSFYAYLKNKLHIIPTSGDSTLQVVNPTEDVCRHLHIEKDKPVIKLNHITKISSGEVLEFNTTYTLIENFKMHVSTKL